MIGNSLKNTHNKNKTTVDDVTGLCIAVIISQLVLIALISAIYFFRRIFWYIYSRSEKICILLAGIIFYSLPVIFLTDLILTTRDLKKYIKFFYFLIIYYPVSLFTLFGVAYELHHGLRYLYVH